MKTLYLARHAKSSWKHPELSDIERPLNKRGKRDAPFIGNLLKEKGVKPDKLISSPAVRAKKTAAVIAEIIGYPKNKILIDKNIYEASSTELINIIQSIDDKYNSVMMFGHNPGFTMVNNFLTDSFIDNIPTCGVVGIRFNSSWKKIENTSGKAFFLIYPKLFIK
ncbi:MAG: histidine phosphatase family protein [Bacteroidetes bacterium]|nr:histidine phosphatase family protein [Bacteroidota bacterium]